MTDQQGRRPLPSAEELDGEIEKMTAGLFTDGGECEALCRSLNDLWDEQQTATDDQEKKMILAEIKANVAQQKALHCPRCLPQ